MSLNCNTNMGQVGGRGLRRPLHALSRKGHTVVNDLRQGLPLLTERIVGSKRVLAAVRADVGMPKLLGVREGEGRRRAEMKKGAR